MGDYQNGGRELTSGVRRVLSLSMKTRLASLKAWRLRRSAALARATQTAWLLFRREQDCFSELKRGKAPSNTVFSAALRTSSAALRYLEAHRRQKRLGQCKPGCGWCSGRESFPRFMEAA